MLLVAIPKGLGNGYFKLVFYFIIEVHNQFTGTFFLNIFYPINLLHVELIYLKSPLFPLIPHNVKQYFLHYPWH